MALLDALARASERFVGLSRELGARAGVASTANALSFRGYRSGPMLEAYAEAELENGEALTWSLDATWGAASWAIRYGVSRNDATGHHRVLDFDEKSAATLEEFLGHLEAAVTDLIDSARTVSI